MLALLVGVSLILLTAYFGESPNSPLHTVQRGVVEVLSPVQEGASKALKPVRDIAGWFSDTFNAASQRDKLRTQVQRLTALLTAANQKAIDDAGLRREVGLDSAIGITGYHPVTADVIQRDPNLWYQTINVDRGSDDGVHRDDPVVGNGALVGKVTTVGPTFATVTLITDHDSAVTAEVQDTNGDTGVLVPAVGNPNQLLLTYIINRRAPIQVGQQVVTEGFSYKGLTTLFPTDIPIGTVSNVNPNELLSSGQVSVAPAGDLRHLTTVQILTAPNAGNARAQVPSTTSNP